MPPTTPSDVPRWCTAPPTPDYIQDPGSSAKDTGWAAGVKPPNNWVNWFWNLVYQWVLLGSKTSRWYSDLESAVDAADANLAAGDVLWVFDDDNATGPGTSEASIATSATGPGGISACGDLVAVAVGTGSPIGVARDLTTSVTYTRTNSGQNWKIKTDGTTTVVAYGDYVEAFNATTGASLWVHDNDSEVHDLCMCDGFVYIVHAISGAGGDATALRHAHKLNASTGAVVWSLQHTAAGGNLRACTTNGRQLFVCGTASSYASGATVRAIRCSDGYDATGECNNGDADGGLTWNKALSGVSSHSGVLDCDGRMLYIGLASSATNQVLALGLADGSTIWGWANPDSSADCNGVAVDQDYVLSCQSDFSSSAEGYLYAHDKATGAASWRYAHEAATPDHAAPAAVATDGVKIWLLGDDDQTVRRISRGNVPTQFRVVDVDAELFRYGNWKLQPTAQ